MSAEPGAPAPVSVEPSGIYAGAERTILLRGTDFTPATRQQLGSGTNLAIDATFRAFLGDVELGQVIWIDSRTLQATVPAGLAPGTYDVSVQGPYGSGSAPDVFQAIAAQPASISATAAAPQRVLVGDDVPIQVTLTNAGGMTALAVTAQPATSTGPAATLLPPTGAVDLSAGASTVVVWHVHPDAPGTLQLSMPFPARDAVDGTLLSAVATASIAVVTPAHLTTTNLVAPPSQPAGPTFQISVDVINDGGSDALAVQFPALAGGSIVQVVIPPPSQNVPAGQTRTFLWTIRGTAEGTVVLGTTGGGTDATTGATVAIAPVQWTVIIFDAVALLVPSVSVAPGAMPGETITLSLTLNNPGIVDALGVQPSIAISPGGLVTPVSAPAAPADVPAGQQVVFTWTYSAASAGDVRFDLGASGTDARSGNAVSTSAVATVLIGPVVPVAIDPFSDGTSFAYVFSYANRIYVGPGKDGASAVRMNADGTAPEPVHFGFVADVGNVKSALSPTPATFPSLGFTGCTPDTLACGPDNEDGRGLFNAVTIGTKEWLFAAGARQTSVLKHLYLTTDTTATPRFPYVGTSLLGGGTRGTTAVAALGTALYVGFADSGGSGTPVLVKVSGLPADSTQPLNPTVTYLPTSSVLNSRATGLIDALAPFSGSLYAGNDGGCASYNGSSWFNCTPSATAWTAKLSVATSKSSDF